MSQNHPAPDRGDENVERLIGRAYRPDAPDPAFVKRVEAALLDQAAMRHPRAVRFAAIRRLIPAAAAAALIGAVGWLAWTAETRTTIDAARVPDAIVTPPAIPGRGASPDARSARALPVAPEAVRVATGDRLTTGASERRRVTLPDGSILYVNAGTEAIVEAPRRVRVKRGSVYVEVRPDRGSAFRVVTPRRELTALGTRFAVDVAASGATDLLVTHGRVSVDDLDRVVTTGERLVDRNGEATVEAAPRTSHLIDWTRDLAVAAESALVPSSGKEGGALIAIDPWGQEARLSLRKYHVDVHIEDGFARTTIDQTYFNHANWRMEGTFYFPLPADASLSRLAMYVAGDLMEGGMTERNRARDVYEEIRYQRRDPALLEWIDGSTFKMRVFPLEPREEKRILLSYTQRLPEAYGRTTYRFPAGHDLGIVGDWSFAARVVGGAAWTCTSHALAETRDSVDTVVSATEKGALLDDDVVLDLRIAAATTPDTTSFRTFLHEGQRYLMVRHRPELAATPAPARRDWIVLFESSGARDPVVARAQVEIVRELLALAEEGDRFAVITAATRTRALSDALLPATPENVAAAIEFLDRAHLVGAFDLGRALDATRPFVQASPNAVIVHVGSGVASLGERGDAELVKQVPADAQYVGVAVGKQWSRGFMKEAAARSGGHVAQIHPTEPLRWRTFDLRATLDTPRLLGVRVVDDAERAAFLVFDDAVAHGEEIAAITRLPEGGALPETITIAARLGGERWLRTVRVADVQDGAGYLPRQWARLEIDRLVAAGAEAHREEIVAHSKATYVMSPFTSLLVLENDAMYEQFGVDRGRKDHWALYPAPAKTPVVREPVGSATADAPEAAKIDEVLGTILVRGSPPILWDNAWNQWGGWQGFGTFTALQMREQRAHATYGYLRDFDVELDTDLPFDSWGAETPGLDLVDGLRGGWRGLGSARQNRDLVPLVGGWGGGPGGGSGGRSSAAFRLSREWAFGSPISAMGKSIAWPGSGPAGGPRPTGATLWDAKLAAPTDGPVGFALNARLERFREVDTRSGQRSLLRAAGRDFSSLFWERRLLEREDLFASRETSGGASGGGWLGDSLGGGAGGVLWRMQMGSLHQLLQFQRPQPYNDVRVFTDLVAYAPGMNTTWTDVLGVLEREGATPVVRGTVDPAAAALIDGARNAGLVRLDWGDASVLIDGAGRCRIESTLPSGLREIVVSDGETLRHLYPDLGLGARRDVDRHQRAEILSLAPWFVAPIEDLSVGANVRLLDARTIEVEPVGDDESPAHSLRVRLGFDADGRLAERVLVDISVERDGPRVLVRESYEYHDDSVAISRRVTTPREQSVGVTDILVADARDASLDVDASELVVLPLPYRARQKMLELTGEANSGPRTAETWDEEKALTFVAHAFCRNADEAAGVIAKRFLDRGDTRVGFAVLLRASNADHAVDARLTAEDAPLRRYIAAVKGWDTNAQLELDAAWRKGFVGDLADYRDVLADWSTGRAQQGDRVAFTRRAITLAKRVRHPHIRYAVLTSVMNYIGLTNETARDMAGAYDQLRDVPWIGSYAAYDHASALFTAGDREAAADAFYAWHDTTTGRGPLPPTDHTFASACRSVDEARWLAHWRALADREIERGRRWLVPYAALQLAWVGDTVGADQLLEMALTGLTEKERVGVVLATVETLTQRGEWVRAEMLLDPLLEGAGAADVSEELLQLGAFVAEQRGATARAVTRRERLLDLRYAEIPELLNLAAVRGDHAALLAQFLQLAHAVQALETDVPTALVARVVRIADRWRALDDDPTQACVMASQVLGTLGDDALAWDYLTTPLADRPNESEPWLQMAQQLQATGEIDLADRCYATAFEIEPTNADILFNRANLLVAAGRTAAAREIWRMIADGSWQPRFDAVKAQAKARLGQ